MATPTVKLVTGASIPQLGYGTWRLEGEDATNGVYNAIKLGYRHLDLATAYGNHKQVGVGLKRALDEGLAQRSDLFITSKLWNEEHGDPEGAVKQVLKDLQLEYLDLYLIHWPIGSNDGDTVDPPITKTWERMVALRNDGYFRAAGIANFSVPKLRDLLKSSKTKPAMNQIEIHPYWRNDELIRYCNDEDVAVTAYSPFGSEPPEGHKSPMDDDTVNKVADKLGKSVPQVLLRWGLQRGYIVIPKATSKDNIKDNLKALEWELSEEDMKTLSSLSYQERNVPGDMCLRENGPAKTIEDIWEKGLLE